MPIYKTYDKFSIVLSLVWHSHLESHDKAVEVRELGFHAVNTDENSFLFQTSVKWHVESSISETDGGSILCSAENTRCMGREKENCSPLGALWRDREKA